MPVWLVSLAFVAQLGTTGAVNCDYGYLAMDPDFGSMWSFIVRTHNPEWTWTYTFPSHARCLEAHNVALDLQKRTTGIQVGDCR